MNLRKNLDQEPVESPDGDDAIIGRAFRWSLLVIVAMGMGLASLMVWRYSGSDTDEVRDVEAEAPQPRILDRTQMPVVQFTDVTAASGIQFIHSSGATGSKLLPETMGSGVAFFDYDNDGDFDLLLARSSGWPDASGERPPALSLYQNNGLGKFSEATESSGLLVDAVGTGIAIGDYDGNGYRDIFLSTVGPNLLFRNDGGRFAEVSRAAKVGGASNEWSTSASFLDYDNDHDLDLFVCNYVRWSRSLDIEVNFTLNGSDRAYGPPTNFVGTHSYLYRNDGDGGFMDVSEEAGIRVDNPSTGKPMAKALAVAPIDLDSDGFLDLIVANDTVQNFLFHNQKNGTFAEIGAFSGLGFDSHGSATGAMGVDAGYYRNDDSVAIGIANFANEMTSLMVSHPDDPMLFSDLAPGEGIGSPSRLNLSFGLFFFDYDLDGRLDLLQVNGHLEEEIGQVQESQTYRQSAQLFWNGPPDGESTFVEVPGTTLGDLPTPIVGRSASYSDFDGDGDLDVIFTQVDGPPLLLRNDQSSRQNWLRVQLRGKAPNIDAVGAWIELVSGDLHQKRQVMPSKSYLSQVEPIVTFGLGPRTAVDSLIVRWPDGKRSEHTVDRVNQMMVLDSENSGH